MFMWKRWLLDGGGVGDVGGAADQEGISETDLGWEGTFAEGFGGVANQAGISETNLGWEGTFAQTLNAAEPEAKSEAKGELPAEGVGESFKETGKEETAEKESKAETNEGAESTRAKKRRRKTFLGQDESWLVPAPGTKKILLGA